MIFFDAISTRNGKQEKDFSFAGSPVATKVPDGNTRGDQALCSPGENHWAYIEPPRHYLLYTSFPILIEPFRPGET